MIIGTMQTAEAKVFDQYAGYRSFHAEETQEPYGSLEIFWHDGGHMIEQDDDDDDMTLNEWRDAERAGWYWWACHPGCLPDGEPCGPFAMSRDALEDADEWSPEFDG